MMILRFFLIVFAIIFMVRPAEAQSLDTDIFSNLPVQHEGRIKPLDTFARQTLDLLAGRQSLPGITASSWLAEALFDPGLSMERPVFRILDSAQIGLPPRKNRLYSFTELAPALQDKAAVIAALLQKDEKTWDKRQSELIRLHEAVLVYTQIVRSFSYYLSLSLPLPEALAKEWNIAADKIFTLDNFSRYQSRLDKRLARIVRIKGDDPAKYTEDEQQIAAFSFQIGALRAGGENNVFFRIVPGAWQSAKGAWFSPWAIPQSGQGSPQAAAYLSGWEDMAHAFIAQDAKGWQRANANVYTMSKSYAPHKKLTMERLYTGLHPLSIALSFYVMAFAALIAASILQAHLWKILSITSVAVGICFHTAAIILRVAILERPPVGTLYESIIFVALICAGGGMVVEMRRRDGAGIMAAIICAGLLLFTAFAFSTPDTMQVLTAVLNTNFWLATHVLCITIGYGVCILTSILAHLWLVRRALGHDATPLTAPVKTLALCALLFTAVGTILGGIWADQSWGRFWGWDPKENGALLIVLWLIWTLHGQISTHLKTIQAMAAHAALSIIVALAWFGVNLLNTGLHSYGFITGVATGLGAFITAEILLIGGLLTLAARKGNVP